MPDLGSQRAPSAEPPLTRAEALTANFYAWERRGRGWDVWPYRVRLEPPFRPFFHGAQTAPAPSCDDGRHPTLLSRFVDSLMGRESVVQALPPQPVEEPQAEPWDPWTITDNLVEIEVAVPPSLEVEHRVAEQLLLSLASARYTVGLEIVGTRERIVFQVSCREEDRPLVEQQFKAHFPEAVLVVASQSLRDVWNMRPEASAAIVDFGLAREFMVPLRTWRIAGADPLVGIVGALSGLAEGEVGVFQVLLAATQHAWAESVMRAVSDGEGGSFFVDARHLPAVAAEKVSRPLFAAVVRVGTRAATRDRAWQITRTLAGSLRQFGTPGLNELVPLEAGFYDETDHEEDLLSRWSQRCGVLLNSEELASLAHLPSALVRTEKLARQVRKTKAASTGTASVDVVLGENLHDGKTVQVGLTTAQRLRHTYVIGASGTGKSTLLLNLIAQDIEHGEGFAVLDPHGDLVDQVLGRIPESRHQDVVIIDPSDAEFPVGFNIISAHSDLEKTLLSSDLVGVFRRLSTSWGDQMTSVLGNAILAFLERPEGGTLFDLRRFLIEADFRREVLKTVADPEVVYYWQREFPLLTGKPQAPLLTRLDTFLRPKIIRNMVAQRLDHLDFAAMMNEGKIVLAKLAQGAIGEENAALLGALLVSRLHQVSLSRQEQETQKRRPFYLYIDEFHNFVTPSMASLLSGARKFGLGLVLAHQDLRQIWNRDSDVASAVLANPCTRICFRVGDQDAAKLQDGFASFTAKDLQNLGVGEAVCRIDRVDNDFTLSTRQLPTVEGALAQELRGAIVETSRSKYARPRAEVEAALQANRPEERVPELEVLPPVRNEPRRTRDMRAPEGQGGARAPRERLQSPPQPSSTPGRGGPDHKYWQSFIKAWADKKGYRAAIEKQVLDGSGSVDVVVESGAWSVAFEISVTSTLDQELKNVQKCLAAGFQHIVLVLPLGKLVARAREHIEAGVDEKERERVHFVPADELPQLLSGLEAEAAGTEDTIRGYKVRVEYKPLGEDEGKDRRRRISDVIMRSLRNLTGPSHKK